MYRYLAIIWNPQGLESVRASQTFSAALTSRPTEWSTAYEGPGALVVHKGTNNKSAAEAYRLDQDGGVILGKLFNRHHDQHAISQSIKLNAQEGQRIVASGGQHLVDHYWGSYVAMIHDRSASKHHVFREPTANMPCYHTRFREVDVFFSHIEDCIRFLPIRFSINRNYLTRWLIIGRLLRRDCGLEGVEDMRGGERLTLSQGNITRAVLWDPVQIARTARFEQPDEAAEALRSTVQNTISSWASCYQNIVHKLSGGLDSSIVAGCLAEAPSHPQLTFLHLAIEEFGQERLHLPGMDRRLADRLRALTGFGDERHFARLVAAQCRTPLIEKRRDISMDLTRLWQAPLTVSPNGYFTAMEGDDAEIELVKNCGTQAFFSGQAGDSVFFATTQALSAIDYVCLHGIRFDLWQHLVSTSSLSKESLWAVLGKAIKHGSLRRPWHSAFSVLQPPTLIRKELIENLTDTDFTDSWVELGADLPPGKRYQVGAIAGATFHDCVFHGQDYADHIDPLNSQPTWELMLQIPTYTVLAGGISRGLARRAFADLLPPEIRKRQAKGTGAPFYQQLVRRNRSFLRENLLNGLLVQEGYLDRQKLEDYLAAEEPFLTVGALTVLCYLAAEVWLQQWAEVQQEAAATQLSLQTFSS